MKKTSAKTILLLSLFAIAFSCKKWVDPAPQDHPEINKPYCNDPDAVNYNWDFPGKPDNTTCFYPSDLFVGTYRLKDSLYNSADELFLAADSADIVISKVDSKHISVSGLCGSGQVISFTAGATYQATVDTLVGDSTTISAGQIFCRTQDTVIGTFTRDRVDSSLIYIRLNITNDTGGVLRMGRAYKK